MHAARDFIYVAVFGSLPWLAWQGPWAAVFALLLTCEVIVTIADFIVEDRVRRALGGLLPGERATHALMGIVYGMMLANLVPNLLQWWTRPAGLVLAPPDAPLLLRLGITAMALGILVSGLRDLYAVLGLPRASWPWRGDVAARASR